MGRYYEELYNDVEEEDAQLTALNEDDDDSLRFDPDKREPPPTKAEIMRAMERISKSKAPGSDCMPIELLSFGGETALDMLHEICEEVWKSGAWPDDWTRSLFVPIPKKGDLLQCSNYRTIALVSHASKILLRVILDRMQQH